MVNKLIKGAENAAQKQAAMSGHVLRRICLTFREKKLHIRCTAALSVWHFCYKFLLNGEERHNEFESSRRVMWHLMFVLVAIIHISHNCSDGLTPKSLWLGASSRACCMHCCHWLIFMLTLLLPPTDLVKYFMRNKDGLLAFLVTPSVHVVQTDLSTDLITSSNPLSEEITLLTSRGQSFSLF